MQARKPTSKWRSLGGGLIAVLIVLVSLWSIYTLPSSTGSVYTRTDTFTYRSLMVSNGTTRTTGYAVTSTGLYPTNSQPSAPGFPVLFDFALVVVLMVLLIILLRKR